LRQLPSPVACFSPPPLFLITFFVFFFGFFAWLIISCGGPSFALASVCPIVVRSGMLDRRAGDLRAVPIAEIRRACRLGLLAGRMCSWLAAVASLLTLLLGQSALPLDLTTVLLAFLWAVMALRCMRPDSWMLEAVRGRC